MFIFKIATSFALLKSFYPFIKLVLLFYAKDYTVLYEFSVVGVCVVLHSLSLSLSHSSGVARRTKV